LPRPVDRHDRRADGPGCIETALTVLGIMP